jgi:hypothetical protein
MLKMRVFFRYKNTRGEHNRSAGAFAPRLRGQSARKRRDDDFRRANQTTNSDDEVAVGTDAL